MATIIIKNNSGSDITINDLGGLLVEDGDQITASDLFLDGEIYESEQLKTDVTSGDLVINDGSSDLSISDALEYLTVYNYSLFQNAATFEEDVDDRVSALIQDGTGISWTYNDGLNTLTGNVSLATFSTTDLSEGTNLYYTDTRVDTRVQGQNYAITGTWTFNSNLPTSSLTPTSNNEFVTKEYVDSVAQGIDWQDSVLDRDLTTSPGSPTTGDRYIIAGTGGSWSSGTINDIAEYNGSSWDFTTPNEGFATWLEDEDLIVVYNGTNWISLGSSTNHNSLSGLQGGTTGQYYHLTSAQHTEITTFFASTDISGAEAEILTDGSNADSLHVHTSSGITNFSEAVDDRVAALLIAGNNITLTYNDGANTLTVDNDITDFTDLGDTPANYGGASAGDFVVVNGTTDGLEFVTLTYPSGTGTDNRLVRWDGTGNIQDSLMILSDTGNLTPVSNASQDLGSDTLRWQNIYITNSASGGSLEIGISGNTGSLTYNSSTSNLLISGVNNTILQSTSGRVGIGTTNTNAQLTIDVNTSTDAPLQLTEQVSAPTTNLSGGQMCVVGDQLYVYDDGRAKWLSAHETCLQWGRNGSSDGVLLSFGGTASNSTTGPRMPFDGTITYVTAYTTGGNSSKQFNVGINGSISFTFGLSSNVYTTTSQNTNFSAGDRLGIFCSAVGASVDNPVVILGVRWRI